MIAADDDTIQGLIRWGNAYATRVVGGRLSCQDDKIYDAVIDGVMRAIRLFKPETGVYFHVFARKVVAREVVRSLGRLKGRRRRQAGTCGGFGAGEAEADAAGSPTRPARWVAVEMELDGLIEAISRDGA